MVQLLALVALPAIAAARGVELIEGPAQLGLDGGVRGVSRGEGGGLPIVVAHGMGDACRNPGMEQITQFVGKERGVYSVCISDGDGWTEDTVNAFLTTMWAQVDHFAKEVRADAKLSSGFDAMGFSQGNLVIRGYVHKYNDPPVRNFLSVHGPMAGTGSLPRCDPVGLAGVLCRKVADIVGDVAYTDAVQALVAQANFLKDPTELEMYKKHNPFLPFINNEVDHPDAARFKANFASLASLLLVRANQDTMIFPHDSEWFGFFKDGTFNHVVPFNGTAAFSADAFGLRSLYEAGKVSFFSTEGNHLQFSLADLRSWLKHFA